MSLLASQNQQQRIDGNGTGTDSNKGASQPIVQPRAFGDINQIGSGSGGSN